ncbi:zinc finger protein 16-like, partial [Argonauta hians]
MEDSDLEIRTHDEVCDLSSWHSNSKKHSSAFMHINAFAEAARACNSDLDADQEMVQHCSICGKGFYHVHDLRDHELTHISGASAKCNITASNISCNMSTNSCSSSTSSSIIINNNNSDSNDNKNFLFGKSTADMECTNGKLGSPCDLCINQDYSSLVADTKCLSDCDICDDGEGNGGCGGVGVGVGSSGGGGGGGGGV